MHVLSDLTISKLRVFRYGTLHTRHEFHENPTLLDELCFCMMKATRNMEDPPKLRPDNEHIAEHLAPRRLGRPQLHFGEQAINNGGV